MSSVLLRLHTVSLSIRGKKRAVIHFQIQGAGYKTAGTQAIQPSIYLERNKTLFHSVLAGTTLHQQSPHLDIKTNWPLCFVYAVTRALLSKHFSNTKIMLPSLTGKAKKYSQEVLLKEHIYLSWFPHYAMIRNIKLNSLFCPDLEHFLILCTFRKNPDCGIFIRDIEEK